MLEENVSHYYFLLIVAKIDESERLRPEELNQQNIEALVAENNLVSTIIFLLYFCLVSCTCAALSIISVHSYVYTTLSNILAQWNFMWEFIHFSS